MNKTIRLVLGLLSITGIVCAQENKNTGTTGADKIFELPPYSIERRFRIDLEKGNVLQIELGQLSDLEKFTNIDSLLLVFLNDMKNFSDSLSDHLSSKRIDYIMDASGKKKIRFRQFRPDGSSFLLGQGEPAALKLEQDTINIIFIYHSPGKPSGHAAFVVHYDQISLYLNQYNELVNYVTGGLNSKMSWLQKNLSGNWTRDKTGKLYLVADPSITAPMDRGHVSPVNDYLSPAIFANAQNYKNLFAPSLSLGAFLHINHGRTVHELGFYWEPVFLFASNTQGHLQTYRNDFLVVTYVRELANEKDQGKDEFLKPAISLGYKIYNQGEYFEKNSFRLGTGRLKLFQGKTILEPCIYFHDFFRGVTPGLRISLRF
ncbi:hypothetical protein ACX0G9_14265 [Flavitalea flava]